MIALHLKAENDTNGNPRRLFLILDADGAARDAVDEGYAGTGALNRAGYPNLRPQVEIKVTPGEYRDWIRAFARAKA